MKGVLLAIAAGALFAVGLAVSGMTMPSKVIRFLDVTGAWDPTLAFVMLGAIAIHTPFVRLVRRRAAPMYAPTFHLPATRRIDPTMVGGAAVFGVGWGLSGYCPGPALVSLTSGVAALVFVTAMLAGIAITRTAQRR